MQGNQIFDVIRSRQAVRRFSQREVPLNLLQELLDLANRAPSGFNLQPWHFIIVRDPVLRKLLTHVALDQLQVLEAPITVVFVANPDTWKTIYKKILDLALKNGAMTEARVEKYRRATQLQFFLGPFALFGWLKNIFVVLRRLKKPTPTVVTSKQEAGQYVITQTMLCAATFMLAAKAAGLDTCPMEGFDEYRIKKLLKIPASMRVPIIVPIGYAMELEEGKQSVRLSVEEKMSIDQFSLHGISTEAPPLKKT